MLFIKNIVFLNFSETIFCILISLFILLIIKAFSLYRKLSKECEYPLDVFKNMVKDFYLMFPKEVIMFKGTIYKRGMVIKITTIHKKIYEGEFVGFNGKDMICVITKNAIVTTNIKNLKDIFLLKNGIQ